MGGVCVRRGIWGRGKGVRGSVGMGLGFRGRSVMMGGLGEGMGVLRGVLLRRGWFVRMRCEEVRGRGS